MLVTVFIPQVQINDFLNMLKDGREFDAVYSIYEVRTYMPVV